MMSNTYNCKCKPFPVIFGWQKASSIMDDFQIIVWDILDGESNWVNYNNPEIDYEIYPRWWCHEKIFSLIEIEGTIGGKESKEKYKINLCSEVMLITETSLYCFSGNQNYGSFYTPDDRYKITGSAYYCDRERGSEADRDFEQDFEQDTDTNLWLEKAPYLIKPEPKKWLMTEKKEQEFCDFMERIIVRALKNLVKYKPVPNVLIQKYLVQNSD